MVIINSLLQCSKFGNHIHSVHNSHSCSNNAAVMVTHIKSQELKTFSRKNTVAYMSIWTFYSSFIVSGQSTDKWRVIERERQRERKKQKETEWERDKERETEREGHRETDRQTDRWTVRQMHRLTQGRTSTQRQTESWDTTCWKGEERLCFTCRCWWKVFLCLLSLVLSTCRSLLFTTNY